jgi:hypothetical protein
MFLAFSLGVGWLVLVLVFNLLTKEFDKAKPEKRRTPRHKNKGKG